MCSAWHRLNGLGKFTNVTPKYGDGFCLVLTRERYRKVQADPSEAVKVIDEVRNIFPRAERGTQFVEVWVPDTKRKEPWYILGREAHQNLRRKR